MIRIPNVTALFSKQLKDTLKNMPVLILFFVYPFIALVMSQAMSGQNQQVDFFLAIFGTMHCVFTPVVATAALMSEEKQENTLRVLIMSNVTLKEYFISTGGFVLIADLITGSAFLFLADRSPAGAALFLLSMGLGCLISIIAGISIGLYAKNTAAANGFAVPFGMVFAFMPMLAFFNKSIKQVSRFTYSQQVNYLLSGNSIDIFGVSMICINLILFILLATMLYRRSLLEG